MMNSLDSDSDLNFIQRKKVTHNNRNKEEEKSLLVTTTTGTRDFNLHDNNTKDVLTTFTDNDKDNDTQSHTASNTTSTATATSSSSSRTHPTPSSTRLLILQPFFSILYFVYNFIQSTMRLVGTLFQSSLHSIRRHPTTTTTAVQPQAKLQSSLRQNTVFSPFVPNFVTRAFSSSASAGTSEEEEVREEVQHHEHSSSNKKRTNIPPSSLERSLTLSTVSTTSTSNYLSSPSSSSEAVSPSSSPSSKNTGIHDTTTVLIPTPFQIKNGKHDHDDYESAISSSRSPSSSSTISGSSSINSPISLHSPNTKQKNTIETDFTSSSSSPKRLISFITDIEGDGMYFDRYVYNSKILDFESVTPTFHCNDHNHNEEEDYFPYEKRVIFKSNPNANNNSNSNNTSNNDPILVCGGDMWDKGGSDLYVTRQLLSLQKRYGTHRVQFILGNRDINKMRILQELGVDSMLPNNNDHCSGSGPCDSSSATASVHVDNNDNESLPIHGGVYWLHGSGQTGDTELIAKGKDLLQNKNKNNTNVPVNEENVNGNNVLPEEYIKAMVPSKSAADRLRWMLKRTMGSPDAFELRRNELIQEKKFKIQYEQRQKQNQQQQQQHQLEIDDSQINVSDEEVVQSYKSSTHPLGVMGQYLRNGHLALQIGTIMFLHGSLPFTPDIVSKYMEYEKKKNTKNHDDRSTMNDIWSEVFEYAMPFAAATVTKDVKDKDGCNETKKVQTTSEWIDALNTFAQSQTEAWKLNVTTAERHQIMESNILTKNENVENSSIWSTTGGYQSIQEGTYTFGSLCQYGMGWMPQPGREKNPTVVYDSWITNGMPIKFYGEDELDVAYTRMVRDFFDYSKLDVIVTGHQPVGDVPLPIQVPRKTKFDKSKFIVCADTSYSGDTIWKDGKRENVGRGKCQSFRGEVAVTEVLMEQSINDENPLSNISCHGVLSDGTKYESVNFYSQNVTDPQIGQLVDGDKLNFEGNDVQDESSDKLDWWVRSRFQNGDFLVTSAKGYSVFNSIAQERSTDIKPH